MARNLHDQLWHADGYERGSYWASRYTGRKLEFKAFPVQQLGEAFEESCKQAKAERARWMRKANSELTNAR